ncbi:MAG TPA: hypothetical protein PLM81_13105 [Ginsengibacter sp.]|nr:hypothetical protein [Ginsengibacter sp.]HRP16531.1 hypothetical protein [Ginsengibacter sp.]HRP44602.1 hypothetical protein [Ginsengibacter sp.]
MKLISTQIFIFFFLWSVNATAQINVEDSSAQAVTYWNKGEVQTYIITNERMRFKGTDTSELESGTYEVTLKVLDSTENSYTLQWVSNVVGTRADDVLRQKLLEVSGNVRIVYKTDEMGAFMEVVNWEELRDRIDKAIDVLAGMNGDTKDNPIAEAVRKLYSTKEAIESVAIKDILQFHLFFGVKYLLSNPVEMELKVPNIIGSEPFDARLVVELKDIYPEDALFVLTALQQVDEAQLENSVFDYMSMIAKETGGALPVREELKGLKNEVFTVSSIHDSGWVLYSEQTSTASLGAITKIEKRTIRLKEEDM